MSYTTKEPPSLSFDLYEAIISSALDGWKHGGLAAASDGRLQPCDIACQTLLAACCLVSRDFTAIALRRLYSGVRYSGLDTFREPTRSSSTCL